MPDSVLEFTAIIVSSFVAKNRISGTDLSGLVQTVHNALTHASAPPPDPAVPQEAAVTIRRSVTPNAIFCMDCGKAFKSLKRHLNTDHDLSPDGYRAKWGLPKTYPMTAPAYSATRSALAKRLGLGTRGAAAGAADASPEPLLQTAPESPHDIEPQPAAEPEPEIAAAEQAPVAVTRAKRAPEAAASASKAAAESKASAKPRSKKTPPKSRPKPDA